MAIDRIEHLESMHALQVTADKATAAIDFKIENATDVTVECRVDVLELMGQLIRLQSNVIKHYVEENESIIEHLESALTKIPQKK